MSDSRIIAITGVTRGLGAALVDFFVKEGHRVCGCGRSSEGVAELNEKHGSSHDFSVVNVARNDDVKNWATRLIKEGKTPDILINNAALINVSATLWKVPEEEFSQLIDVNIKGVYYSIRWFVPAMIERGSGVIVNFSSGWGRSVSPEVAPYCSSKWAIEGLSKALAEEIPQGMAVIPLNPGIIDTDMLRSCFAAGAGNFPKAEEWATRAAPFILNLGPKDNGQSLSVS